MTACWQDLMFPMGKPPKVDERGIVICENDEMYIETLEAKENMLAGNRQIEVYLRDIKHTSDAPCWNTGVTK